MIKDNLGKSYFLTVVLIFLILLVSLVCFEFFRLSILTKDIRDSFRDSLRTVTTKNLKNVYKDLRELDFNVDDDFENIEHNINVGIIKNQIFETLRLKDQGNVFSNHKADFSAEDIRVAFEKQTDSSPLNQDQDRQFNRFVITGQIHMKLYLSSYFKLIPPIDKTIFVSVIIATRY